LFPEELGAGILRRLMPPPEDFRAVFTLNAVTVSSPSLGTTVLSPE